MNLGPDGYRKDADKAELKEPYRRARSGQLVAINGTPVVLVRPFSGLFA